MPTIVLTNHYDAMPLSIITEMIPAGFEIIVLKRAVREELLECVAEADYLLASGRLKIDKQVIDSASKLKMVQRTGVGTDSLDLEYLKKVGIPTYVNKGVNSSSVAEHTIMLMLSTLRNLISLDRQLRDGIWEKQNNGVKTHTLSGKTVGLVGIGEIGKKVATMLCGFNTKTLYYDVFKLPYEDELALGIEYCDFESMLAKVDVLSFHCALTEKTQNMLNEENISKLKASAIVINTSRGELIDERSLIKALKSGKIRSAGLDVYENEPLPGISELAMQENVILTPHIAGVTYEAFKQMMQEAMCNIYHFENGNIEFLKDKRLI